jgi:5'-nucleotidase
MNSTRMHGLGLTGLLALSAGAGLFGCGTAGEGPSNELASELTAELRTEPREVIAHDCQDHEAEHDTVKRRDHATRRVFWRDQRPRKGRPVPMKVLGFNDFHGQLSPRAVSGRPAGGAAVLAAYLKAASAGMAERTFIVHAGDFVGGSPPNSALLQDEPAISFLNGLTNRRCSYFKRLNDDCNVIGTLGNHEFDEGRAELFRLIDGGNHANGPFLEGRWRGARYEYISSNVVDTRTNRTILPPYTLRRVDGVPVAFIGAVLKETPTIVTPTGVEGLRFDDEAESINRAVRELRHQGVRAFVVQIHQGTGQLSYEGETDAGAPAPTGPLTAIVQRLDDDVDVIVAGHTHQFTNALLPTASGKEVLITQAFSAGTAFSEIEIVLDSKTRDVIEKSARIVTTWADQGPGLTPDAASAALVAAADARVAPLVNLVVANAARDVTRTQNQAGESALGDLIADSQRAAIGADFALMNPGGIRADLAAGEVTWGELFTVQPFGNTVVGLTLTGQQLYDVLNQQWGAPQPVGGRILQISGFSYTWDSTLPEEADRVLEIRDASGNPIDRSSSYRVAVNNFIAAGGDNFTVLRNGTEQVGGPVDLDALIEHLATLPQPFEISIAGRIVRQ